MKGNYYGTRCPNKSKKNCIKRKSGSVEIAIKKKSPAPKKSPVPTNVSDGLEQEIEELEELEEQKETQTEQRGSFFQRWFGTPESAEEFECKDKDYNVLCKDGKNKKKCVKSENECNQDLNLLNRKPLSKKPTKK